ncbi:hypothetical protein BH11MYX1_BH11MYX1_54220 [soil metagenome]
MIECLTDATVAAYVDGALGLDEVGRVDHHIDGCVQCRAQLSTVAASPHSFTTEIAGSTPGIAELVQQTIASGRAGDPLPATALGRYVIDEVIGRGGMGVVVRARDPELDRFIAIKLVDPARRHGAWRVHVREEARAMAKLRHPNVVAVYDAGSIGDQLFIAMELVDGSSLARWRGRERARALAACLDAGRGVCAAHAVGVIHGDIKPDNILVGVDGRTQIGDFGLSRAITDGGARGVAGTPGYMAPELTDGGAATVASDQSAFAVTVSEVLFGEQPRGVPRQSAIARPLWRVIERGLARDPTARFPTMQAFVAALERAARPRRRRIAIVAASLAVVGGTVAWFGVAHGAAGVCTDPIERSLAIAPPGCTGPACATLAARALAWRTTSVGVCEVTRAGRQSDALLDRRMRCLDQRRLEHAELARQATQPSARIAVEQLQTPESCANLDSGGPALRLDQLPADSLARGWLATATASSVLGHYQQAYDQLAPHFATIRALGQGSLTAATAQLLGELQVTLGKL